MIKIRMFSCVSKIYSKKNLNIVMIKIRMFSCVYQLLSIKYQATIHELKTHAAMGYIVIESICNR